MPIVKRSSTKRGLNHAFKTFLIPENFKHTFLKSLDLEYGSVELDIKRYYFHNTLVKQHINDQAQKNKLAKKSCKGDRDGKSYKEMYTSWTIPRAYV